MSNNWDDHIKKVRTDYAFHELNEKGISEDPMKQFSAWLEEAIAVDPEHANAMTLSTANQQGQPSSRIVLLRGIEIEEGGFVFYTNYSSKKGMELNENRQVGLNFFWKELMKQVRIEGVAQKINKASSDEYFATRPKESQIGAWASQQSQVVESRAVLEEKYKALLMEYKDKEVTRPEHWGGYLVRAHLIEFWQGRSNRLHDRIQYTLQEKGSWKIERLSP